MTKIKVLAFSVSLDGFGAGPNQSLQTPLGRGGEGLHTWMFHTKVFQGILGKEGGTEGVNNDFAAKSFENIGAWIMGRNMFSASRGPWVDDGWKGWWGNNPPYHVPVYILTNHPRESITMEGGTVFHFVTEGIDAAVGMARKAANGKDIRIGGGVSTIRQFLQAGYVDEMHFVVSPVLLGSGENFFNGIDLLELGYTDIQTNSNELATHVEMKKKN